MTVKGGSRYRKSSMLRTAANQNLISLQEQMQRDSAGSEKKRKSNRVSNTLTGMDGMKIDRERLC